MITGLTMFDCFLILIARKKSHRKKSKAGKNVVEWKKILIRGWCIVLNSLLSTTDSPLLKLMGPSAFIPVHKLWLHNKLSLHNYELCITKCSRVVRLFNDAYIFKIYLKWVTLQKLFQISTINIKISKWDLAAKIIKSRECFI